MEVYRITLTEYSEQLTAPGTEGRWNSRGKFVIYTAGSIALACLENLVHRNSEGLKSLFSVLSIDIPTTIKIKTIHEAELPKGWLKIHAVSITRRLGNEWLASPGSAVLKVPSAIIAGEYNYLLNPTHPQFKKITILKRQPFEFDNRLK